MAQPIARQVLRVFDEPVHAAPNALPTDDRRLDWVSQGVNPLRLSAGELRLVRLLAQGLRIGEIAVRMAVSVDALRRRIGNIYRKLSWDVRSGSLSLLAA